MSGHGSLLVKFAPAIALLIQQTRGCRIFKKVVNAVVLASSLLTSIALGAPRGRLERVVAVSRQMLARANEVFRRINLGT
jgi:hypothetical protein